MTLLPVEDEKRIANFVAKDVRENAFAVDIAETGEEMPLNADNQLLRRFFSNLIDNALKYAES